MRRKWGAISIKGDFDEILAAVLGRRGGALIYLLEGVN